MSAPSTTTAAPECEAARRNKQALYEIELAWGNGVVDLGKLLRILKPTECNGEHSATNARDPEQRPERQRNP